MIGYQASHEQFKPSELLGYVQLAERAGFTSINSSDHFKPWSKRQGHSGFAFAFMGAALQSTSNHMDQYVHQDIAITLQL